MTTMHSPFPGMDPFLETPQAWRDFQLSYCVAISRVLNRLLPDGCHARTGAIEYAAHRADGVAELHGCEAEPTLPRPDVITVGTPPTGAGRLVLFPIEQRAHRHVEVRRHDRRDEDGEDPVVAAVEVLTPEVKSGDGRAAYLLRRQAIMCEVPVLEIDLFRGGGRAAVEPAPPGDYAATLTRPERLPAAEVWAWNLRDPLPILPVPEGDDAEVPLDLRAALDEAYDAAHYARWVYRHGPRDLAPPLSPADTAWAAEFASGAKVTYWDEWHRRRAAAAGAATAE